MQCKHGNFKDEFPCPQGCAEKLARKKHSDGIVSLTKLDGKSLPVVNDPATQPPPTPQPAPTPSPADPAEVERRERRMPSRVAVMTLAMLAALSDEYRMWPSR